MGKMYYTKEDYGDSDRLDPDYARQFINDLINVMVEREYSLEMAKEEFYGDTWTLLYGIGEGITLMKRESEYDVESDEYVAQAVSNDSWQEHYDEYGHGAYGRGLKIGKRLAFYEDRDFTIRSYDEN